MAAGSDAYTKLEEGSVNAPSSGSWPSRAQLIELMEERSVELLMTMVEKIPGEPGTALASMLCSSATDGIAGDDLAKRLKVYGENAFAEKKLKSYMELVCDGLHDLLLQLLIGMAVVSYIVETLFGDHPDTGWILSLIHI